MRSPSAIDEGPTPPPPPPAAAAAARSMRTGTPQALIGRFSAPDGGSEDPLEGSSGGEPPDGKRGSSTPPAPEAASAGVLLAEGRVGLRRGATPKEPTKRLKRLRPPPSVALVAPPPPAAAAADREEEDPPAVARAIFDAIDPTGMFNFRATCPTSMRTSSSKSSSSSSSSS